MDIFTVRCPGCQGRFYGDVILLGLDVDLHCPFCGRYFRRQESPQVVDPHSGRKSSVVGGKDGSLTEAMVYRPRREDA